MRNMRCGLYRFTFLLGLILASSAMEMFAASPGRPNIVLFLADDLGWHDVGYHGSEIRTPNIDRLAASGVRLERFYVQPVCSPTRAALMTGRYPIRLGLQVGVIRPWAKHGLPLVERTLPQALRDAGYTTAIVGKWHLGTISPAYLPTRRGFDHQYGHFLGMIDYYTHERMGGLDWHRDDEALREEGYTTNLIAAEAVRVVENHDTARPLFLYVPFNAPHTPLQAPDEFIARYDKIRNRKRRIYAAMVSCMDDAIGQVLGALEKRGLRKNTLVLFASDNGGPVKHAATNTPLRAGKGTLYEGGVRVPAVAVWPGKLKAGTVIDQMMHIADWYPTLLGLGGANPEQPLPLDGMDVWPTITGEKPSPRTEILHNIEPTRGAVRVGDWKLIFRAVAGSEKRKRDYELYNVVEDPSEKHDLAAEHPEKVNALIKRLAYYEKLAVPPKGLNDRKKPKGFNVPDVWGE